MVTSLLATAALFSVFFLGVVLGPSSRIERVIGGNTDPSSGAVDLMAADAGLTSLNDAVRHLEIDGRAVRILGIAWPNNRRARAATLIQEFAAVACTKLGECRFTSAPALAFSVANHQRCGSVSDLRLV
jgi:hypothetical protein